jgi:protein-tyrosine sulfotransferase
VFDDLIGNLPLGLVAWGYNVRRSLRMLTGQTPYPLADRANSLSCQPMLIVSAGRSGTTLLRSMLVASEQIAIPPESFALPYAALQFQAMQEQSWYNLSRLTLSLFEAVHSFSYWETNIQPVYATVRSLPEQERSLARVLDILFMYYAAEKFPQARLWGDQSPENAKRLRWLWQVFPNGKYVHVLRDGRDVVASFCEMGESLEGAIQRWRVSLDNFNWLKQHVPASNIFEVRYEDLVAQPETSLRDLSAFLAIDYSEEMLNYWQKDTTVEQRFLGKVHENLVKPVFSNSVGSWRKRLNAEQQQIVQTQLSKLLAEKNYS